MQPLLKILNRLYRYEEDYLLSGLGNQNVQINLDSSEFDTYLYLLDASTGEILAANDDANGYTNSQLNFTTQAGQDYLIQVTSYDTFETGSYSLTAYIGDELGSPTLPAPPMPPTSPPPSVPPVLPNNFDSMYGYGLVNAAAAVAAAVGQSTFEDVADRGGFEWNNDMIFAPEVWSQGYTGQGVTVAVIDSGVDIDHADLRDSIWVNEGEIAGDGIDNDGNGYVDDIHGWNFDLRDYDNNVIPDSNLSGQEHGTHVAGTIVAANDGVGMTGVAYDAEVMAIRIAGVTERGIETPGDLAEAIRYAVDNGADVINMSLRWLQTDAIVDALAYAASQDVITVSASGNDALGQPFFPANYAITYGLSVGAVDHTGAISHFSNNAGQDSRMHHVMAPGQGIRSTVLNDGYATDQGTSMAAPHVAGVVALMLSANPDLTHEQVREILIGTSSENPANTDFSTLDVPASATVSETIFDLVGPFFEDTVEPVETVTTGTFGDIFADTANFGVAVNDRTTPAFAPLDTIETTSSLAEMGHLSQDELNMNISRQLEKSYTGYFQSLLVEQPIDEFLVDEILSPAFV
ncbi:MAG: S8 family peptidase [Cyanobacteria bacterium J06649_4]